eukprot:gb/GECH01004553.1/.p1 GENE.gb/GECH01004553.1/~~gb/GECH01004553.1/.p1  ORF type:complete len:639 (+),score=161.78 gb/GECH01004553.1/:1-1917(+)
MEEKFKETKALRRIQVTLGHIDPNISSDASAKLNENLNISPSKTSFQNKQKEKEYYQHDQHWNGWGYDDTAFVVNKKGQVELSGDRYLFSGKVLPDFRDWMEENFGVDVTQALNEQSLDQALDKIPSPTINEDFLQELKSHSCYSRLYQDRKARLDHAHGHSCQEIYRLRLDQFERVPDLVVFPGCHEHVEKIMELASRYNVAIIPFGGGTSVSQTLLCSKDEKRMIVSLDTKDMCRIKWVDHDSHLACIESGAVGKKLHEELSSKYNMCLGHEPDSFEFSTLGGWISTRASGMKKNVYGNIEDLIVTVKMVTPQGTMEKGCPVPRSSTGPDINHFALGSEGLLGIITEAVVKISPLPKAVEYGSIAFPDFESGVRFMREVARQKCAPASIRLVDNVQFHFGHSLKPEEDSNLGAMVDWFKKIYLMKVKGFDPHKMVVATLLFEGREEEVQYQQQKIYRLAPRFGGLKAGPANGKRGYFLTYVIAYLRDFAFHFGWIAESFETSVPWNNVLETCNRVKQRIFEASREMNIPKKPFVSCRITQTYDTGAAIYFYLGFAWQDMDDPTGVYSYIEEEARNAILNNGGCLSHHHGVGKLRKQWTVQAISETGVKALSGLKSKLDPQNILATGNMGIPNDYNF